MPNPYANPFGKSYGAAYNTPSGGGSQGGSDWYNAWRQNFGQTGSGNPYDLNQDSVVDARDWGMYQQQNPTTPPNTPPTPPPDPGPTDENFYYNQDPVAGWYHWLYGLNP